MFPEEYSNTFYLHPSNSAQGRWLRNVRPQQQQNEQREHQGDNDYLEEEERATMTGIVRATIEKYPDTSTYPHIVETKRPRTLVEQRIEFWQHPVTRRYYQKNIEEHDMIAWFEMGEHICIDRRAYHIIKTWNANACCAPFQNWTYVRIALYLSVLAALF